MRINPKALLAIAAIIIAYMIFGIPHNPASHPDPTAASTPTTHPAQPTQHAGTPLPDAPPDPAGEPLGEGSGDQAPTRTPGHQGGDDTAYTHTAADLEAATEVTTAFIRAWLAPDSATRTTALTGLATPALATQLGTPGTKTWHTEPDGPPTVAAQAPSAVQLSQQFTDGRHVVVLLLHDPTLGTGWLVADIQPAVR